MKTSNHRLSAPGNPFDGPLSQTESLVGNWASDATQCRTEIQQWDGLQSVADQRRRIYGKLNLQLRTASRIARATVRWKNPALNSFWTTLRYRWLSWKCCSLRVRISVIALLICIHRIVFWALHFLIPLALLWLIVLLGQILWEIASYVHSSVQSEF